MVYFKNMHICFIYYQYKFRELYNIKFKIITCDFFNKFQIYKYFLFILKLAHDIYSKESYYPSS